LNLVKKVHIRIELSDMNNYTVPAVDRFNQIVTLLEKKGTSMNISEISDETGIAKTTCLRLLSAMTQYGFLAYHSDRGQYGLGTRFIQLGKKAENQMPWMNSLRTILRDFVSRINETAKISILENDHTLVILREESSNPLKISLSTGSTFPIHAGGASKMLLAGLSQEEQNAILPRNLYRFTGKTITSRKDLKDHLSRILEQGYAVDNEEYLEGLIAVAVPVTLPGMNASLSVSFLKPESPEDKIKELLPLLKNCARDIETQLFKH